MKNGNKPVIATAVKDKALYVNAVGLYNALGVSMSYADWLKKLEADYYLSPDYELYIDDEGIDWIRTSYAIALCHVVDYPHSGTVAPIIRELDRKWREQMNTPTAVLACGVIEFQRKVERLTAENDKLRRELATLTPKAECFDKMVSEALHTNIYDTASELGVPLDAFRNILLRYHYVRQRKPGELRATKLAVDEGLFWEDRQTVTPKGRETFRLLCSMLID